MLFKSDAPELAQELFKAKKYDQAYATLVQASFSRADDPRIYLGLALTLEKLGRFESCEKQWSWVKARAPQFYNDAHRLRHAASLVAICQYEAARDILLTLDPALQDHGEKWELIEHITAQTGAGLPVENQTPCVLKQVRVNNGKMANDIVRENDALARDYQQMIANTGQSPDRLRHQSVVMVTYGRTGSTLLQGMLNTIDGLVMLGETENTFFHLFSYLKTIKRLVAHTKADTPSSPFYGAGRLDEAAAAAQIQATITNYFAPFQDAETVQAVGFKDVKYTENPHELVAYLEFLESMLPQPLFIFLWRDHDEVLKSGWWKTRDRIETTALLELVESESLNFAKGRENCFTLTYADLTPESPVLRDLFGFMGAGFDPVKLSKVLQIPHSYAPQKDDVRALFAQANATS